MGQLRERSSQVPAFVLAAFALLVAASSGYAVPALGQAPDTPVAAPQFTPQSPPQSWVDAAVKHELQIVQDDSIPLRYRLRRISQKDDITRVVIESKEGNVARLIQHKGQALTAAEDATERSRLNDILRSPEDYLKHEKKNNEGRDYALQIIKLIPHAMIYTYTPGQPQPSGATSPQVVIDFHPDPAFKPPTLVSELLTGLEGRVWIDARTAYITRIQGRVLHNVNFGWGVIAKIYAGGTIELEQTRVGSNRWVFSHLEENLTIREMLLRTVTDKMNATAWDFEPLPHPISFQDAVRELLAMPVKLR